MKKRKQGTFKRKKFAVEKFCKNILREKKTQNLGAPPPRSPQPLACPAAGAAAPRLPAASREADPAAAAPEELAAAPQPPCACLRHRIRSQDGWGRRPPAGLGREERPRRAAGRRASPRDAPPRRLLPAGRRSRALPRAAAEEAPRRALPWMKHSAAVPRATGSAAQAPRCASPHEPHSPDPSCASPRIPWR